MCIYYMRVVWIHIFVKFGYKIILYVIPFTFTYSANFFWLRKKNDFGPAQHSSARAWAGLILYTKTRPRPGPPQTWAWAGLGLNITGPHRAWAGLCRPSPLDSFTHSQFFVCLVILGKLFTRSGKFRRWSVTMFKSMFSSCLFSLCFPFPRSSC